VKEREREREISRFPLKARQKEKLMTKIELGYSVRIIKNERKNLFLYSKRNGCIVYLATVHTA